jgi:hypothetical protein
VRIWKRLAATLGVILSLALVLEAAFRLAGLWIAREPPPVADGSTVVLCVGDSHTRGRPDPENYPAALERLLNERTGRRHRVVNLGVPGLNTTELRTRFARYLDYYRPAVVLHWAGINNGWNHLGTPRTHSVLGRLADHSKLVRLVRVALFYRGARRQTLAGDGVELANADGPRYVWHTNFAGVEETIETEIGEAVPAAEVEATTREDLTAMMALARQRGIPMFAATYPFWGGTYAPVNRAVAAVSADFGVPLIDSAGAVKAAAAADPGARLFDDWVHPMPNVYRRVAEEAYDLLVAQGLVAAAP